MRRLGAPVNDCSNVASRCGEGLPDEIEGGGKVIDAVSVKWLPDLQFLRHQRRDDAHIGGWIVLPAPLDGVLAVLREVRRQRGEEVLGQAVAGAAWPPGRVR